MQTLQQSITIKDIVDFINLHRTPRVFIGWSDYDICIAFGKAFRKEEANYVIDPLSNNTIVGICLVERNDEYKIITALELLVKWRAQGVVASMLQYFKGLYPPTDGWSLQLCRRDNLRRFTAQKTLTFCNTIIKKGI